ncbi:MAG TPA: sulfatase [Oceanipulchritudo sp.]|nr:sulfatase [Oceanipulchritudo sp.]
MNRLAHFLLLFVLTGLAGQAAPRNVLLICIDDLRPEIHSFGADYIHSPNMDKLAAEGRAFTRHYVNAPSCGPSRYTLLTGRYGYSDNNALVKRAQQLSRDAGSFPPSMPEWFRMNGFTTVSVGKVSHHPGGLGGTDWNDPDELEMPNAWDRHLMPVGEWQHPRGAMHGLAFGKIRKTSSEHPVYEAAEGADTIYPDGLIADEALRQLEELAAGDQPFFLAVGLIKPHLPFGCPKQYLDLYQGVDLPPIPHPEKPTGTTTWHGSGEFKQYQRWGRDPNQDPEFADELRRHYAACVSYADAQVGKLIEKLKASGAAEDTVVVIWGDHGWHLGEHAVWGKHTLFEESLRSPLIIGYPGITDPGVSTNAVVETLDLFPTLCDLAGVRPPEFVSGTSLLPQLNNPAEAGHPVVAYWREAKTVRTDRHRLIVHNSGEVELYDHSSAEQETLNIADENPGLVEILKQTLADKTTAGSESMNTVR